MLLANTMPPVQTRGGGPSHGHLEGQCSFYFLSFNLINLFFNFFQCSFYEEGCYTSCHCLPSRHHFHGLNAPESRVETFRCWSGDVDR